MDYFDIAQLIIELLILLLLLYLAFLKSYFQEKGKNLATKEDIEEITSKVESIKSQLAFSMQAKLSLRAEEHESLVDYYTKHGAWLAAIANFSFSGISDDNAERLDQMRDELNSLERDFELASSRLELFVEDSDIMLQKSQLSIKTLEFHSHAHSASYDVERWTLEVKKMKLETPLQEQLVRYRDLFEQHKEFHRNFKEEQGEMFRELYPMLLVHRKKISAHLQSLVNSG